MGGTMPITQLRLLLKQPGIKQEEVKWSGIDDSLRREGKVTKQEVLDFLDANRIEIREVAKGEKLPEESREENRRGMGENTPGGRASAKNLNGIKKEERTNIRNPGIPNGRSRAGGNYREILFTLPPRYESRLYSLRPTAMETSK